MIHPKEKITFELVSGIKSVLANSPIGKNVFVDPDEQIPKEDYPCLVIDTDNEELIQKVDRGRSLYKRRWPVNFEIRFVRDFASHDEKVEDSLNRLKKKVYDIELVIERFMSFPKRVSSLVVNCDLARSMSALFSEGELTYRANLSTYELEYQTSAVSLGAYDVVEKKLGKIGVSIDDKNQSPR